MKKTIRLFAIILLLTAGFASCRPHEDPQSVLKAFFEHLIKKDIEGAAQLATKNSRSTLDMVKKGMDLAEQIDPSAQKQDPAEAFKNAEFSDASISGDTAFVTVTNKTKGEAPAVFTIVKEEGKWKVDFSMKTLMKMGTKGSGQEDGAKNQPPSMLTPEQMETVQKAADSLKK
ncbi:hypothetical protein A8C56_17020 [Niabella ginsenosidivorans]|uniref:DUF4878 domain-containing protein n=1 Tax=Niabella ginsenosidivorans TaxID=1176587 RepID=A0A1A9I712_9BACT|nr:DUF4878 domain-containing protein [Niabella ginsenosidivorans]ANH82442.1 hypothetical protein A8C56_17020 [Niabella ginsenosidivorans]